MENENTVPAEQTDQVAPEKPNNIDALERKNRELLQEKQKEKQKREELEARLSEIENKKLESEGKYADIAESRKKRVEELEKAIAEKTKTFVSTNLENVVRQQALEMGSKYPDLVLKALDKSDLDMINVDDRFQPDREATKSVLERIKSNYPDLFAKTSPGVKDFPSNPSGEKPPQEKRKVSEMTLEELKEAYKKTRL